MYEGDECVIMGWGGTKEGGQAGYYVSSDNDGLHKKETKGLNDNFQREDHLRKVRVPVQSPESCTRGYGILFK